METGDSSRRLRIFVVENHEDTLRALEGYLRQMGHEVWVARSVGEALVELPKADCDVLISDIGLCDGTGWDLMERVRLARPIFAIAMSGYGVGADVARSKAAGFRHHLVKPADPDELDVLLEAAAAQMG